jgi:hypothetical protein
MIITGIIMFFVGVLLINFLQPNPPDVRLIQLKLLPKIIALLITFGGIIVFLVGLISN